MATESVKNKLEKSSKNEVKSSSKPKKLSKTYEVFKTYIGTGEILDMRAVLK
jgi:hypothetical protein